MLGTMARVTSCQRQRAKRKRVSANCWLLRFSSIPLASRRQTLHGVYVQAKY